MIGALIFALTQPAPVGLQEFRVHGAQRLDAQLARRRFALRPERVVFSSDQLMLHSAVAHDDRDLTHHGHMFHGDDWQSISTA